MKSPNDAVAARIAQIHQRKNISQHAVAQALGICDSAYSRIEAGSTELTLNRLYTIAEALKEEVSALLGIQQGSVNHQGDNNCIVVAHYNQGTFHFSLDEAALKKLRQSE